jgi:hypothetical protein
VVKVGVVGEQVENEDFHDATPIAVMRLACRPGKARNAGAGRGRVN